MSLIHYPRWLLRHYTRTLIEATRSDLTWTAGETVIFRGLFMVLGTANGILLSRSMGPEGRGVFTTALTVGDLGLQLTCLGLHAANAYYASRDRRIIPTLVANSLSVAWTLGGAYALSCAILFTIWPSASPLVGILAWLAPMWVPLGLSYTLLQGLLLGVQRVRTINLIELAVTITALLLIILFALLGRLTPVAAFLTVCGSTALGMAMALTRLLGGPARAFRPSPTLLRQHLAYASRVYLASFLTFLVIRSNILVVQYVLGAEHVGYYSAAMSLAWLICIPGEVVGMVIFPRLSAMANDHDRRQAVLKVLAIAAPLIGAAGLTAIVLAGACVRLLYGVKFLPSVAPLRLMVPGAAALAVSTIITQTLASMGLPRAALAAPVAAAAVSVGLSLLLVPRLGLAGAALSSVLAYLVLLFASAMVLVRTAWRSAHAVPTVRQNPHALARRLSP